MEEKVDIVALGDESIDADLQGDRENPGSSKFLK